MDLLAFVRQVVKHAEVASDASSTPLESISKAISTLDKEICEHWLGKDATEKAKVSEWVSFSAGFETVKETKGEGKLMHLLTQLDATLLTSSFAASVSHDTVADIVLFYYLKDTVQNLKAARMIKDFPSVARWYNLIQHQIIAKGVDIELINFVLPEAVDMLRASKGGNEGKGKQKGKDKGKEKGKAKDKEAKKGKAPKKETPSASSSEQPEITLLDFRVGKIVSIEKHPEKDKLYCEKIDVGEDEPRTIASGLVDYYPEASALLNRKVLVVCNLKPRKMGGFVSKGMLLCASTDDKSAVEVVDPPEAAQVGDRVVFPSLGDTSKFEPWAPNKVGKKKVFEKVAPNLKTNSNKEPIWVGPDGKDHPFVVANEKCSAPTIAGGNVS